LLGSWAKISFLALPPPLSYNCLALNRRLALFVLSLVAAMSGACAPAPDIHSPYDGTYLATFRYEYQAVTRDQDRDLPGSEITGPWTPAAVEASVTFRTTAVQSGRAWLTVVDLVCSDPIFGANTAPFMPRTSAFSSAAFPIPPDRSLRPGEGVYLALAFPNGSSLSSSSVAGSRGTFTASTDGRSLSYSWEPGGPSDYGPGAFTGSAPSGPFGPLRDHPDFFVRGLSWTLVKTAD
jgi:hypothetical protein